MSKLSSLCILVVLLFTSCATDSGGSDEDCYYDSITITDVEPSEAEAGVETEFTISFDYCLVSEDTAMVYYGFNLDPMHPGIFGVEEAVAISSGSKGHDALTVTTYPVAFEAPYSFKAYLNLSPMVTGDEWDPMDADSWPITVEGANPKNISTENQEDSLDGGLLSQCYIDECQ